MDRLTGKDAKLMMEALASVYTKAEVEQEVISEEVAETELVLENEEYEKLDENLLQLFTRNRTVYRRDPNTGEKIKVQQQRDPNNLDRYIDKKTSGTGDYGYREKKPGEAGDGTMGNFVRRTGPKPGPGTSAAPAPQKSARQQELDSINADKNLSPMQKWAKANPKLAAAKAERDRTRGTAQTDNPLMKDMRSRMPSGAPTVQSPAVAKLGAGNQSLVNNPNAGRSPAPAATAGAAAKPAAVAAKPTGGAVGSAAKPLAVAAKPTGSPAAQAAAGAPSRKEDLFTGKPIPSAKPTGSPAAQASAGAPSRKEDLFTGKPIPSAKPAGKAIPTSEPKLRPSAPVVKKPTYNSGRQRARMEEVDIFDTIKEHLISEHELSEDVAIQVMTLLDEETRGEIMEYTAAIRADAAPKGTTMKMTATGKEPAGDRLLRGIKDRVGGFLQNLNPKALKSTTVEPRKPLVSTQKNSYELEGELVDEGSCGSKKKPSKKKRY